MTLTAARSAADLWRWFWHKVDDIGCQQLDLVKTKGHATAADVQQGRVTDFERTGNDNADHFAGAGVEVAARQVPNACAIKEYQEASAWYRWLARLCTQWPKDTDPRPSRRSRGQCSHTGQQTGVHFAAEIGNHASSSVIKQHDSRRQLSSLGAEAS